MEVSFISVKRKMASRLQHLLPGSIVFAQDFAGDGSPESIRQHLTYFTKNGQLKRLSQGVYVIPKSLGNYGELVPGAEEIATALARRDKARIIPTGEFALWKLGFTTQVPLTYVYLTDGPSRVITVEKKGGKGDYSIVFKHASPKNFALRGKISGPVMQALKAIGEKNLDKTILDKVLALIIRENTDDLTHDLTLVPVWISKLIKNLFTRYKHEGLDTQNRNRKD